MVFIDETLFSNRCNKNFEWSAKRTHVKWVNKEYEVEAATLLLAVSSEYGLEGALIYGRSINSEQYCKIFELIEKQGSDFVVLCDNAGWHRSTYTKKVATEKGINHILSVPYKPILNPVEKVHLQLKTHYKNLKLQRIVKKLPLDNPEMIKEAL